MEFVGLPHEVGLSFLCSYKGTSITLTFLVQILVPEKFEEAKFRLCSTKDNMAFIRVNLIVIISALRDCGHTRAPVKPVGLRCQAIRRPPKARN